MTSLCKDCFLLPYLRACFAYKQQFLPSAVNPQELWHGNSMPYMFSRARKASYLDTSSKFFKMLVNVPMLKSSSLISHSNFNSQIQLQKCFCVSSDLHQRDF